MTNIERFNEIIDYIESHLTEEIDIGILARLANMSVYEFRRIFAFAANSTIKNLLCTAYCISIRRNI